MSVEQGRIVGVSNHQLGADWLTVDWRPSERFWCGKDGTNRIGRTDTLVRVYCCGVTQHNFLNGKTWRKKEDEKVFYG